MTTRRTVFAAIEGWQTDRQSAAFRAFGRSASHALSIKAYRTGSLGISAEACREAFAASLDPSASAALTDDAAARAFFETWFEPVVLGNPDRRPGLVTGYYEPMVFVAHGRDQTHACPFLRRPAHLVEVPDPDNPPEGIEPGFAFMLDDGSGIRPCPDRAAIEDGAFDHEELAIAWARDPADVFFAQVQGSARLAFPDGSIRRITYAAKSGHPFTGIGRLLVDRGEIPADAVSMQSIRAWLATHPTRAAALMRENRSYIFFKDGPVDDPGLGPVGAAKVPLEAGRSLAVDRQIHTFGLPVFVEAAGLSDPDGPASFRRLMIAQDTGSAITGLVRGDIFFGSGEKAGEKAGNVKAQAQFTLLVPKELAEGVANG